MYAHGYINMFGRVDQHDPIILRKMHTYYYCNAIAHCRNNEPKVALPQ